MEKIIESTIPLIVIIIIWSWRLESRMSRIETKLNMLYKKIYDHENDDKDSIDVNLIR